MRLNRPTVLILSSDAAFAREITAHWPKHPDDPEFVVMEQDLCGDLPDDTFDLAIVDTPCGEKKAGLKNAIGATSKPAILIGFDVPTSGQPLIIELNREPQDWAVIAGLLGREMLHRCHAEVRVHEAERMRWAAEADATLGRYMAEMRHSVNNALTSILGNSELILLEPGLPANVLAQADTVRNMALRLHEVFQRFSSIEKELTVAARESSKKSRSAASGI